MRRIQTIEVRRGEGLGKNMSLVIERSHLRLKGNGLEVEAAKIPPRNKTGTPAPKGSDLQAEMDGYRVQDPRRVKGTERKANLIIQVTKEAAYEYSYKIEVHAYFLFGIFLTHPFPLDALYTHLVNPTLYIRL